MSWWLKSFRQTLNQWCAGSLPNSHSIVWNLPWRDYLHYGNRQTLQMMVLWSLGFGVLSFPFSSKVVYQLTMLGVLAAKTLSWVRSHSLPEGILHPRIVNAEVTKSQPQVALQDNSLLWLHHNWLLPASFIPSQVWCKQHSPINPIHISLLKKPTKTEW